jgi:hypothetical protein
MWGLIARHNAKLNLTEHLVDKNAVQLRCFRAFLQRAVMGAAVMWLLLACWHLPTATIQLRNTIMKKPLGIEDYSLPFQAQMVGCHRGFTVLSDGVHFSQMPGSSGTSTKAIQLDITVPVTDVATWCEDAAECQVAALVVLPTGFQIHTSMDGKTNYTEVQSVQAHSAESLVFRSSEQILVHGADFWMILDFDGYQWVPSGMLRHAHGSGRVDWVRDQLVVSSAYRVIFVNPSNLAVTSTVDRPSVPGSLWDACGSADLVVVTDLGVFSGRFF